MVLTLQTPADVQGAYLGRLGIYGATGAGKTSFLATIPPEIPTLVLRGPGESIKPLVGAKHIRIGTPREWADLDEAYRLLRSPSSPFKAVAFDTWSYMLGLAANKIAGATVVEPGKELEWLKTAQKRPKGWDAWDDVASLSTYAITLFNSLPIHTIYLFQEETRSPKFEADVIQTGPAVTPGALKGLQPILEMIGRLYADSGSDGGILLGESESLRTIDPNRREVRRLFIGKHDRFYAKGNTQLLGRTIEDPTWGKLAPSFAAPTT